MQHSEYNTSLSPVPRGSSTTAAAAHPSPLPDYCWSILHNSFYTDCFGLMHYHPSYLISHQTWLLLQHKSTLSSVRRLFTYLAECRWHDLEKPLAFNIFLYTNQISGIGRRDYRMDANDFCHFRLFVLKDAPPLLRFKKKKDTISPIDSNAVKNRTS